MSVSNVESMSRVDLMKLAESLELEVVGSGNNGYVSKEDLVVALKAAGVTETANEQAPQEDLAAELARTKAQMARLEAALVAAQRDNAQMSNIANLKVGDQLYRLTLANPITNVTVFVTDPHLPNPSRKDGRRRVRLTKDSRDVMLTAAQIAEIKESTPKLFSKGLLSVPDLMPDNHNHIPDFDTFLAKLTVNDVEDRVARIDSTRTLWFLYSECENRSIRTHDDQGKAFTDGSGKPIAKTVKLPPVLSILKEAVQRRLSEHTEAINRTDERNMLPGGVVFSSGNR